MAWFYRQIKTFSNNSSRHSEKTDREMWLGCILMMPYALTSITSTGVF